MNQLTTVVISDAITFVLSMFSVLFISGMRWGEMRRDIAQIKIDIAKIEGMFVLKIRDDRIDRK